MKKMFNIHSLLLSVIMLPVSVFAMDNDPDLRDFAIVSCSENKHELKIDGFLSDNATVRELLIDFVSKYPSLRKLSISNITLDAETIDILSNIISAKTLQTIEFIGVNLNDQALESVAKLLNASNPLLQYVNLSNNPAISCPGLCKFAGDISDATHIRSLYFFGCTKLTYGQGIGTAFRGMIEGNPDHELSSLKMPFKPDRSLTQAFSAVWEKNKVIDSVRAAKKDDMGKAIVLFGNNMSDFDILPLELRGFILFLFIQVNPLY